MTYTIDLFRTQVKQAKALREIIKGEVFDALHRNQELYYKMLQVMDEEGYSIH